jgi:hypothetical protein
MKNKILKFKIFYILILFMGFIYIREINAAQTGAWKILFSQNNKSNNSIFENQGGGPQGSSFAGRTNKTSSPFTDGWHSYQILLGNGGSLRERYFWLVRDVIPHVKSGEIYLRFDIMGDANISAGGMGFEFLGGNDGWTKFFYIGCEDGNLQYSGINGNVFIAKIEPYIWYRVVLKLYNFGKSNVLNGKVSLLRYGKKNPLIKDISISLNPKEKSEFDKLKLDIERGSAITGPIFSFYLDNILLKVKE